MMTEYWINGRPKRSIDVRDRALQFGDGLFETLRVIDGVPEFLPRHMTRLREGSRRLQLAGLSWNELEHEIRTRAAGLQEATLKVIVTRGASERGYRFNDDIEPNYLVGRYPAPPVPADLRDGGIRVRICDLKLARQPALAGIKHLNRLEQVLARAEWNDPDISEGLLLDSADLLIEGTMSNLFLVCDDVLLTADLSQCGVAGIMRSVIIDLAREQGLTVQVGAVTVADAQTAQELFVCNSLIGIWPIRTIEGVRTLPVGPVTRKLIQGLAATRDCTSSNWYAT